MEILWYKEHTKQISGLVIQKKKKFGIHKIQLTLIRLIISHIYISLRNDKIKIKVFIGVY